MSEQLVGRVLGKVLIITKHSSNNRASNCLSSTSGFFRPRKTLFSEEISALEIMTASMLENASELFRICDQEEKGQLNPGSILEAFVKGVHIITEASQPGLAGLLEG